MTEVGGGRGGLRPICDVINKASAMSRIRVTVLFSVMNALFLPTLTVPGRNLL